MLYKWFVKLVSYHTSYEHSHLLGSNVTSAASIMSPSEMRTFVGVVVGLLSVCLMLLTPFAELFII